MLDFLLHIYVLCQAQIYSGRGRTDQEDWESDRGGEFSGPGGIPHKTLVGDICFVPWRFMFVPRPLVYNVDELHPRESLPDPAGSLTLHFDQITCAHDMFRTAALYVCTVALRLQCSQSACGGGLHDGAGMLSSFSSILGDI